MGPQGAGFAHGELEQAAKEMGAEMTRGTHPFDLLVGKNAIDFNLVLPEELYKQTFKSELAVIK